MIHVMEVAACAHPQPYDVARSCADLEPDNMLHTHCCCTLLLRSDDIPVARHTSVAPVAHVSYELEHVSHDRGRPQH